jgi:LPXTG-site transpeptidase (sortase) family protein
VTIPALDVHASVLRIGARHGVLTPPSDTQALGWWRGSASPGATQGTAVVVGHSVHAGVGVFDQLGTLQPGDMVTMRTQSGAVRYRVSGLEVYGTQSLARHASRLFRQTGPARLVLVTCTGWNGSRYLSNVVVVAEPL